MKALSLLATILVIGSAYAADNVSSGGEWDEMARSDRVANILTPDPVDPGSFLFVVAHRARQSMTEHAGRDFLGFDAGGLKIGVGLRWGVTRGLDLGVFRVNGTAEIFDTVEFDLRYRAFTQERHGVDLALRPGFSWFVQPDREDASAPLAQLLVARRVGVHLTLGAALLYHGDSSGDRKATSDDDHSIAAGVFAEFRPTPKVAIGVETVPSLDGYGEPRPAASISLKVFTYGHTFSLVISNTQYITADGIVTGAWRPTDTPILGFTITRDIQP